MKTFVNDYLALLRDILDILIFCNKMRGRKFAIERQMFGDFSICDYLIITVCGNINFLTRKLSFPCGSSLFYHQQQHKSPLNTTFCGDSKFFASQNFVVVVTVNFIISGDTIRHYSKVCGDFCFLPQKTFFVVAYFQRQLYSFLWRVQFCQ